MSAPPPRRPGDVGARIPAPIRRRREAATAVQRRRQMVTDLAVGVLVAAVVLALSLGLAPVGAVAIVTLVVSAASYPLAGRRLRRRLARSSPGRSGSAAASGYRPRTRF